MIPDTHTVTTTAHKREAKNEKGHTVSVGFQKYEPAVVCGQNLVYGTEERDVHADIVNLPADALAVRRRFRNDDFARVFVKTESGIRYFLLQRTEGGLELTCEQANNLSVKLQNPRGE